MSKGEKKKSVSDDTKSLAILVVAMGLFVFGMIYSGTNPTIGGGVMLLGGLTFFAGVLMIIRGRRKAASIEEDPNVTPVTAPALDAAAPAAPAAPAVAASAIPEPGWRQDPYGLHDLRYFDGEWRADVSDDGVVSLDPVPASLGDAPAQAPLPAPAWTASEASDQIQPPVAASSTSATATASPEPSSVLQSAAFRNAVYGTGATEQPLEPVAVFNPDPAAATAAAATAAAAAAAAVTAPSFYEPPAPEPDQVTEPAIAPAAAHSTWAEPDPLASIPAQSSVESVNAAELAASAAGELNPWAPIAPSAASSPWNQGTAPEPEREVASADETRLTAWRHFGSSDSPEAAGDVLGAELQDSRVALLESSPDLAAAEAEFAEPAGESIAEPIPLRVAEPDPEPEPIAASVAGIQSGWYPDPLDASAARFFDGAGWTEHTRPL